MRVDALKEAEPNGNGKEVPAGNDSKEGNGKEVPAGNDSKEGNGKEIPAGNDCEEQMEEQVSLVLLDFAIHFKSYLFLARFEQNFSLMVLSRK